jgi:hypothetical protein
VESRAGLRIVANATAREQRLLALLAGRGEQLPRLLAAVEDAQLLGSLELSGSTATWDDVCAQRRGEPAPADVLALRGAQHAVEAREALSVAALRRWHQAVVGRPSVFRLTEDQRDREPVGAPAELIEDRLETLMAFVAGESGQQLRPAEVGALVLARIAEIRPFGEGNGRVARLATSQVMVLRGARPPILVGAERERLTACLEAAFRLDTAPLVALLDEASGRAVQVMIEVLKEAGR